MFQANAYGETVAAILQLDGGGERLMPLAEGRCSSEEAAKRLRATPASELFPRSRAPEAAMAGLFVYFSCTDDAHTLAQDIPSAEGSYWHAIVHRQEPDPGNSAYWFHKVGLHPIFPELRERAAAVGIDFGPRWDPFAFIDLCEQARLKPSSGLDMNARRAQLAEWQLLFDYCASDRGARQL